MQELVNPKNLSRIFAKYSTEKILPICHHVQSQYFERATKDWHNPERHIAAENILKLAQVFSSQGIDVEATYLIGGGVACMETPEEAGIHPELRRLATRVHINHMGDSSAYSPIGGHNKDLHFLMGYNTSKCILDTIVAPGQPMKAEKILVLDAVTNSSFYDHGKSEDEVFAIAAERGWKFTTTENVINAIPLLENKVA